MQLTRIIPAKFFLTALLVPTLTLTSCLKDRYEGGQPTGDQATVTFSLQLPGVSKPGSRAATRALAEADENEVRTIEVLQFEAGGGPYIRTTFCTNVTPDGFDSHKKTFKVTLVKGTYDLLILANPRPQVAAGYSPGDSRATVISKLLASLPTGDKWLADPSNDRSDIPMWGQVNNKAITENTSLTGAEAVKLTRMVSKVDIQIGEPKFELTSVYVYNYNDKGLLVPDLSAANWHPGGSPDFTTDPPKALAPTIPASAVRKGDPNNASPAYQTPLHYGSQAIAADGKSSVGEIYLFESENHVAGAHTSPLAAEKRTCLVIGGKYDGGTETFYRVDFANKISGVWKYLDLLRNHKYIINIATVSGPGLPTHPEAFNSTPVNIQADVLEWNDGGMGEVVFDGQHYLSVSQGIFNVGRENNAYTVYVKTDVPTGWKATTTESWISFPGATTGVKDEKTPLAFNVAQNTTGDERTGTIKITAGRLEYLVKVTQNSKEAFSLTVSESNLVFDPAGEAKDIDITWSPAANPCDIAFIPDASGGINFSLAIPATTPAGGTYRLKLTASSLDISTNPFASRSGTLVIKAHNDQGDEISQTVNLKQLKFNTVVKAEDYYMNDNTKTHSFSIRSNTEWKITNVVDEGILDNSFTPVLLNQTGGYNTTTGGQTINFKFLTDPDGTKSGKKVTLTLTDPTGRKSNVEVILKGLTCGTGGVAVKQRIGANEYLTHKYGAYCWMVENSMEGTGSGKAYGLDWNGNNMGTLFSGTYGTLNGYYYLTTQAASACPLGWHLPTETEMTALIVAANTADRNTNPVSKWWCGTQGTSSGAFAGNYYPDQNAWNYWGSLGHWWYGSEGQLMISGLNSMIPSTGTNFGISVRCVQD